MDVAPPAVIAQLREIRAEAFAAGGGYRGDRRFTHRLISRRSMEIYNSTGDHLPRLTRRQVYNPAFLHPDDLDPRAMREALGRLLDAPQPDAPPDEYEGADTSAQLLSGLADAPRARRHVPHRAARAQGPSREHG